MSKKSVYVLGAGGHAKVITEIIQLQGHQIAGFLDDNVDLHGKSISEHTVIGSVDDIKRLSFDGICIGIGNNRIRRDIVVRLQHLDDKSWTTAIHPNTIISPTVSLGIGTVVVAGAIVNIDTVVGKHSIINTAATIDHDCVVGDYVHIAPGAHIAGGVTIGDGVLIGLGSKIIPGCKIGEWAVVGAGSTVITDIPPHITVVGSPARPI